MRTAQALRHLIGPIELIHADAGPALLRLTRIGLFGLWIFKLMLDPLWRLAEMPRELLLPTGILSLFPNFVLDRLLTPAGLAVFAIVTCSFLVLCVMNWLFPISATCAVILITIYSSLIRSFGPTVHTDIVPLLGTYVLAAFAWADYFHARLGKDKKASPARYSYPLVTIVALLCLAYALVGFNRVASGGWQVFTGDTMEVWTIDASLRAYYFDTNIGWHLPEWPLVLFFLRLGLPVITLFEIAAPLCLASSHFRWIFIPTMLSFHLLSLVFMNIFFFDDMLLYLLLIDWSRRFPILSAHPTPA